MSTPFFGKIEPGNLGGAELLYVTGFTEYLDGGQIGEPIPIPMKSPSKRWWIHRVEKHVYMSITGGTQRHTTVTLVDNHGQEYERTLPIVVLKNGYEYKLTYPITHLTRFFYIHEADHLEPLTDDVITAIKSGRTVTDAMKDKADRERVLAFEREIASLKALLAESKAEAEGLKAQLADVKVECEKKIELRKVNPVDSEKERIMALMLAK
jgi:hypothetical protein